MDKEKIIKAGKIASQVKKYAKSFIEKNMLLLDIAEKIESKIIELGGKPAFPVSLCIDNIAAHLTPLHDDKAIASGLLKIDFGVSVDGWLSDTAFSIDLENNEENKKIIHASEKALENAIKLIKKNPEINLSEIGEEIQKTIDSFELSPIINLSGHSMEKNDLHAGVTIPNFNNKKQDFLGKGLFAVEPFATTGTGKVHDGRSSGVYMMIGTQNPRSPQSREVLDFIKKEYETRPFCSRWIVKQFGVKSLFSLKQLEDNGNLHNYPELVESKETKVSQSEHTIFIDDDGVIVTTE